jgi:hypothetical protein
LLAQFIVLMTNGNIPPLPVYCPEDPGFIQVQLVYGESPHLSLY